MIVLYLLLGLAGLFLIYLGFLGICALLVDPHKIYFKNSRFYRAVLNGASTAALALLRVRVHVTGLEKLPRWQRLLFVGNHRSNFDPIIQWVALKPWQIAYLSKAENFKIPFLGRIIRKCCFLPIDRRDPRKAMETIRDAAALLRSGEVSIGVYPEGTRSKQCVLLPFHDGVFRIAQKADAPIAVLAIRGTEQIHKNILRRRTEVYLDIVTVIPAQDAVSLGTHAIGAAVREALQAAL